VKTFDLSHTPLQRGTCLLEASAGTGKTFTIEGLVLRLVVEAGIPLPEILIVTFTEAATNELRSRVRTRLHTALCELEEAQPADPALLGINCADPGVVGKAKQRLRLALVSFDEACIFTIHGFCQRMLGEFAFEGGFDFEGTLAPNQGYLFQQAVEQAWRKITLAAKPTLSVRIYQRTGGKPISAMTALLQKVVRAKSAIVRPYDQCTLTPDEALATEEKALAALRNGWQQHGANFAQWFMDHPVLSTAKKDGYPLALREEIIDSLQAICSGIVDTDFFSKLSLLHSHELHQRVKAKKAEKEGLPTHLLMPLIDATVEALEDTGVAAEKQLLEMARKELDDLKQAQSLRFFDDLLNDLDDALQSAKGTSLAKGAAAKFQAVMIDEFQDTDAVQWRIFQTLFAQGQHYFYLIGDPKQAIYRFRGADVFTYLKAAKTANERFSLGVNYRSDAALIHALNAFFKLSKNPFLYEEIEYIAVSANQQGASKLVMEASPQPLQIRLAESESSTTTDLLLADIQNVLDTGTLDGKPVRPADMAILVRGHKEGVTAQAHLRAAGVPATLRSTDSVYDTDEARLWEELLTAMNNLRDRRLLRAVMLGIFFGLEPDKLPAEDVDDEAFERLRERFHALSSLLHQHGVMVFFRTLMEQNAVRESLLKQPGGERILTNLLHLSELLHQAETNERLTPPALLRWLSMQRQFQDLREESAHELRMEGDENAVQILTAHKSKGLQFPIVFSLGLDGAAAFKSNETCIEFQDTERDKKILETRGRSFLSDQETSAVVKESVADEIRLLYVVLTRAKHRCHLYLADKKGINRSAICAMLGVDDWAGLCKTLIGYAEAHPEVVQCAISNDAQPLSCNPKMDTGEGRNPGAIAARTFSRRLLWPWQVGSFSGFAQGQHAELPDHDTPAATTAFTQAVPGTIHALERSARFGDFFHKLMESLDYATATTQQIAETASSCARRFGFDREVVAPVTQTVEALLQTPLKDGTVTLREVPSNQRICELEWTVPTQALSASRIADHCADCSDPIWQAWAQPLRALGHRPLRGYLKGFIDLFFQHGSRFYLADWKTNWLAPDSAGYTPERLHGEMTRSLYFLQGLLYTAAADRWLALRLPGYTYAEHFGGCFYIFVRGIEGDSPEAGVHLLRPPEDLLRAVQNECLPASLVERLGASEEDPQ